MTRSTTDSVKVIAAIAVVGIHATSTSENHFFQQHNFLSLDFIGVLVNQVARFSVPLFLYLSAYGLAKSEKKDGAGFFPAYLNFLWKRMPTILVPYFFFSGIALVLEFHSYSGTTAELSQKILHKLRIGAADYHLYFLVILAQCYLLFPLLSRIARAYPGGYRVATGFVLVLVAGLLYKGSSELLLPKLGLSHPGWHASFAVYWLPYFMLGILHAQKPPAFAASADNSVPAEGSSQLWKSIALAFGVVLTLTYVVAEYIYYSRQGNPVDYYNHFSRPSVMLYALAVIYLLHSFRTSPFGRGAERIAPLTFSVYLIHPQVLRLLTNYAGNLPGVFSWIITVLVTFALVYALTLLTNMATQKSPAFMAGPVGFLQRCLGLR